MNPPRWVTVLEALGFVSLGASFLAKAYYADHRPEGTTLFGGVEGQKQLSGGTFGKAMGRAPMGLDDIRALRGRLLGRLQASGGDASPVSRTADIDPIKDRVSVIGALIAKYGARPEWVEFSREVINQRCRTANGRDGGWCIKEKDFEGETKALFEYVRRNMRYTRDPAAVDMFSSPERNLAVTRGGDCDDMVIVLGSLLRGIGVEKLRLRVIRTTDVKRRPGEPEDSLFNHIYLVANPSNDGRKWIALDASENKPAGWEAPGAAQVVKTSKPHGIVASVRDFNVPLTA